jgi:hypothetical protein
MRLPTIALTKPDNWVKTPPLKIPMGRRSKWF